MNRGALARLAALLLAGAAAAVGQLVSIEPSELPLSASDRMRLSSTVHAGQWLALEADLFRHVRLSPASAELRKALAVAHFRNERYLAAASEYGRAARLRPLDPASRFTLAAVYIALDRRHWARRELEALATAFPQNALYPHWLSGIYQHYQWFDEAITEARKAIELNPNFAASQDRLGQCLEALGRSDEALAAYTKADRLSHANGDPSPWPSYHLGSQLRQSARFDEALAALKRAAALDPKHAEAQYELGLTLDQLDRPGEALAALEAAVRLDAGNPKFHYALSRFRRRMGDLEGAHSSLETFERLSKGKEIR